MTTIATSFTRDEAVAAIKAACGQCIGYSDRGITAIDAGIRLGASPLASAQATALELAPLAESDASRFRGMAPYADAPGAYAKDLGEANERSEIAARLREFAGETMSAAA